MSKSHCCFAGCTPRRCGCCVKMVFHETGCPGSPTLIEITPQMLDDATAQQRTESEAFRAAFEQIQADGCKHGSVVEDCSSCIDLALNIAFDR